MKHNTKFFTKGEWFVYGDWGIQFQKNGECHVTVESRGEGNECFTELMANLNLIATAPELYSELEFIREHLQGNRAIEFKNRIDNLLAKARGQL